MANNETIKNNDNGFIKNNSDILFIYDASMTNPNGDPDDENKPRMDYDTETNLVSDVRLKRYIRDYLEDQGEHIFVSKVEGQTVDSTQRLAHWISKMVIDNEMSAKDDIKAAEKIREILKNRGTPDAPEITGLIKSSDLLLDAFLDVRLFGATMPVKGQRGESFTFTGPVQFNWGYSLNKVRLVDSSTISSTFAGRTRGGESGEYGTFGKDYRVYYSLIAFHGIISGRRAQCTKLSEADIKLLEKALIKSIPLQATRSKIGQYPRLYIRIEYNDQETLIGDLRKYIQMSIPQKTENQIRDVSDICLDLTKLISALQVEKINNRIKSIHYWFDNSQAALLENFLSYKDSIFKGKLREINFEEENGNTSK